MNSQISLGNDKQLLQNSIRQKLSVRNEQFADQLINDDDNIDEEKSQILEESFQLSQGQESLNQEVQELRQSTRYSLIVPFKVFNIEAAKSIFELNNKQNKSETRTDMFNNSKKNSKNKKLYYPNIQIPKDSIQNNLESLNRFQYIDSNDELSSDIRENNNMNFENDVLDVQKDNNYQVILRNQLETENKISHDKINIEIKNNQLSFEDQFLDAFIQKNIKQNPLAEVIENIKNPHQKPLKVNNENLKNNFVIEQNQMIGLGLTNSSELRDTFGQDKKEEVSNSLDAFRLSSQYIEQLAIKVAKLDFYIDQNEDLLEVFIYTNSNNYEKLNNQSQSVHEKQRQLLNKVYLVLEKIFANLKMSRILFNSDKDQIQPQVYLEYYEKTKGRIEKREFNQVFFAQTETFGFYQWYELIFLLLITSEMFSVGKVLQNLIYKDDWFQKEKFYMKQILEQIKLKITFVLRSNINNQKFIEIYLQQKAQLSEYEKKNQQQKIVTFFNQV